MIEVTDNYSEDKYIFVFISASAGEVDWVIPILDFLAKNKFKIMVVILSRGALESINENKLVSEYIFKKNKNIEVFHSGGYFLEKLEHAWYLSYRILKKFKLTEIFILRAVFNSYMRIFESIFSFSLPLNMNDFKKNKCIFFNEFPSLRRPRDNWLKRKFLDSIFFYTPHSPHIYAKELNTNYPESENIDFDKKNFFLLGHPADYSVLNKEEEYSDSNLEKVFIGHPKYSCSWLKDQKIESENSRSSMFNKDQIDILVLSRGSGSYFDQSYHKELVESVIGATSEHLDNYNLYIKKHPREVESYWDTLEEKHSSIHIIDKHIYEVAKEVDFVISFWSSGAMDCYELGVPVIELYDPQRYPKQQFLDGSNYTSIYRKLGLVYSANNEQELGKNILGLIQNKHYMKQKEAHPFYKNILERSNNWEHKFAEILTSNGFLKS